MFTGLITDIGTLVATEDLNAGKRFRIETTYETGAIDLGASIAHDGVCLTVVETGNTWYEVEAWEEALRLTTLSNYQIGQKINLERALKIGDELGGHMVSGHVDGIANITKLQNEGDAHRFTLEAPSELAKFIAPKGSVCLNGTSLTVNGVNENSFDVLLIKHSLDATTWGDRGQGDDVNLEIDQMARYAFRLMQNDGEKPC